MLNPYVKRTIETVVRRAVREFPAVVLTVLDFVGQAHRRYRIDSKLKALLPKTRYV